MSARGKFVSVLQTIATGIAGLAALALSPIAAAQIESTSRAIGTQAERRSNGETEPTAVASQGTASTKTAKTGAGRVGDRKNGRNAVPNAEPLGRLVSRIENRVQNRLKTRIDRDYEPAAGTTDPFKKAEERTRTVRPASRPR